MFIAALYILMGLLGLVLDLLNRRFLLHDGGVDVLEQLCEFDHLSLDFLDGFVTALDGAEGGLGLASPVRLHELEKGSVVRGKEDSGARNDIQLD